MRDSLIAGCLFVVLATSGNTQDVPQPIANPQSISSASTDSTSASISGTVMDTAKAFIPGATVKIRDSAGREVTVISDGTGRYTASGLATGPAEITISEPGFADTTATVQLTAGKVNTLDSQMQLAGTTTNVEVRAAKAMEIETENAEVSGQLDEKHIVSFGLNGRTFLSLITLTPGVSNQTGQDEAKVGVVGSAKFSVNGGRTEYNTFYIDGNDVLNTDIAASHGHSTLLVYPSLDAIEDMKVLTSNYGAQYGRSASGTVEVQIKSGAEKFHGKAYEFIRNEAFNSRNYFDEPGKAPLYRRQDFGFTVGGPFLIPRFRGSRPPKTFFFLSEEWRKEKTPVEFNQGVPTDAERGYNALTQNYGDTSDFSDVCPPTGGNLANYPDCPVVNGIYQNPINPIATAYLKTGMIPRANANTGCVSSIDSCYVASVSPPTNYREDLLRIDHRFSNKWKFYATGIHDHWDTITATPEWAGHVNSFPSVMNSFLGPGISTIAHVTTVVTPTLLNDFSVGATWQRISLENVPGPGVSFDTSGFDNVPVPMGSFFPNGSGKLPGLIFAGTNAAYGGAGFNVDTSYMPWYHTRVEGTISDNMSKFLAHHAFLFGAQLAGALRHEFGGVNGANSGDQQGLLTFTDPGVGNSFYNFEYYESGAGNEAGNFVQGNPYSYQQDNTQTTYKISYWTLEPYFQDNYKVTPRLILNLGMRISLFQNWKPDGTVLDNWDPAAFDPTLMTSKNMALEINSGYLAEAPTVNSNNPSVGTPIPFDGLNPDSVLENGLVRCGANGVPESCQSSHIFNAAPRVGFAWDVTGTGKTSVRAGYGIFYEHGTGSEANVGSLMGNPPQILSMTQGYPGSYELTGYAGPGDLNNLSERIQTPLNMVSIPTKTIWPYVQQWSFGIQQEVNKDTQITAAYVGSKGTHLAVASQLNQLPPVPAGVNPFDANEPITLDTCETEVGAQELPTNNPNWSNKSVVAAMTAACNGYAIVVNGTLKPQPAENALRPYQGIGDIVALRNTANSSYNSLQLTAHHMNAPVDVAATLTFSHSIDTASDRFSSTFVNTYNLATNRASSDFDQRILLNVNYIYPLPLLRIMRGFQNFFLLPASAPINDDQPKAIQHKNAISDQSFSDLPLLTKAIFSNWSLTGLTLFQTGTPFSVINDGSNSNQVSLMDNAGLALDPGPDSYPDVVPHTSYCYTRFRDTGTIGPLLGNSCRFVAPRGLTQGNAGRNFLNNPRRTNFDIAMLKEMKIWNGGNLEFRTEMFNVFNTTQFVIFDPAKGNTSSNTISCYGDVTTGYTAGASTCTTGNGFLHPIESHRPRTMQFGLKLDF